MACCFQAITNYLSQCWPGFCYNMMSIGHNVLRKIIVKLLHMEEQFIIHNTLRAFDILQEMICNKWSTYVHRENIIPKSTNPNINKNKYFCWRLIHIYTYEVYYPNGSSSHKTCTNQVRTIQNLTHCPLGYLKENFRWVILKLILVINGRGISSEIVPRWISLDHTVDKSTLVQVMTWCHQAASHYLSQCWPRSTLQYGITRPRWVKMLNITPR